MKVRTRKLQAEWCKKAAAAQPQLYSPQEQQDLKQLSKTTSRLDRALNDQTVRLTCDGCGKPGLCLKQCSACRIARYCSRECQKRAWPEHKAACCRAREQVE